jgi:hypothetical protein
LSCTTHARWVGGREHRAGRPLAPPPPCKLPQGRLRL